MAGPIRTCAKAVATTTTAIASVPWQRRTRGRHGVAVLCALVAVAPMAAACSGGSRSSAHDPSASTAPSSGAVATRWWSNTEVKAGSTIDPGSPDAAVSKLHASRTDYCTMLRQTLAAGKSILPGVTAADPALLISSKAFVGEIQKVAPSAIASSWRVLGTAVIALVESRGDTTKATKEIDAAAVQKAGSTVASDAKHSCGVDLSAAKPTK
ncbi:MAG: hypothetical protein QOJ37_2126 [Pseudonocardiales bacterium]|jgi:hypothetical protein|nr:hypothetical protein [Pseudonocardiales bacterium]